MEVSIRTMASIKNEALYFNDVAVGDVWDSSARTVTETDVVNFAALTGDYNPLHVDHEFARGTPFGRPIAHGLLGLSYSAGLGSHMPHMRTVAFVQLREWKFVKPIFIGDSIRTRVTIKEKREHKKPDHGLVVELFEVFNQRQETVLACEHLILVKRKGV